MAEHDVLPYKTINVFMEQDYLEEMVGDILTGVKNLDKAEQIAFSQFFKKNVKVLGFRDPTRAPITLQTRALASAFIANDDVIPETLSVWTRIHDADAQKVQTWLSDKGWTGLAVSRAFNESEGFLDDWPEDVTFDQLVDDYRKDHPKDDISRDDLILLILWISGKLPKEQSAL